MVRGYGPRLLSNRSPPELLDYLIAREFTGVGFMIVSLYKRFLTLISLDNMLMLQLQATLSLIFKFASAQECRRKRAKSLNDLITILSIQYCYQVCCFYETVRISFCLLSDGVLDGLPSPTREHSFDVVGICYSYFKI